MITQSVYLYAFASFSQKPLIKFIYEYKHELTYTIYNNSMCVSVCLHVANITCNVIYVIDITNGILLEIPRSRTVAYKNSFYVQAPSVWNTLPKDLRDTTRSVSSFKTNLCQFYNKLLDDIFDPEDSRTYKTVCIKCHSTRSLLTLSTSSCCLGVR